MITFVLVCLLLFGFLMGLKRGFILQLVHLFSFLIAFIVARIYFTKLADKLYLWIPYPELKNEEGWAVFLKSMPLEDAFYNSIAFITIFIITIVLLRIIASMLDFVANLPVLKQVNKLLGALFGFIEIYLYSFVFLFIVALLPVQMIQDKLATSNLAMFIIEKTPLLSKMLHSLWFTDVLSKLS